MTDFVYLKTVKSKKPPKPKLASNKGAGKVIYEKYCVACHKIGIGGAPKLGDAKEWAPKIALGLNELYKNSIAGIGAMPPKGNCIDCTNKEIQDAVDYMVNLSKPKSG